MAIHGKLFDGRSARGRDAVLEMDGNTLAIRPAEAGADDDSGVYRWPARDVELAELPAPNAPVRLRCKTTPGVVFTTSDPEATGELTRLLPHLLDAARRHRNRWIFAVAALGLSVLAVLGFYFGWPQIARNAAHWIPQEWENRLGDSALSQLEMAFGGTCTDAEDRPGLDALHRLARRLAAGGHVRRPVQVHVMKWSYKNAFALPGGHVVFTSGIVDFMERPDELAGVLAHEIGHVERRHVMISLVENWGLNLFLSVIFGGGGGASDASYLLLASAYSRELEREADQVGLDLLARAGISSAGFARLFERFQADRRENANRDGSLKLPDFIRTHPTTELRIKQARRASSGNGVRPAMSAREWAAVKAVCND